MQGKCAYYFYIEELEELLNYRPTFGWALVPGRRSPLLSLSLSFCGALATVMTGSTGWRERGSGWVWCDGGFTHRKKRMRAEGIEPPTLR